MANDISSYTQVPPPVRSPVANRPAVIAREEVQRSAAAEKDQKAAEEASVQRLGAQVVASSTPATETEKPAEPVDVREVVKEMKDYVQSIERDLEFSVDEESGRTVITVKDSQTEEIIRQIPPEDLLYMLKSIQENNANLFVKVKA